MTLREAINTLTEFYGIETEGDVVTEMATVVSDNMSDEVWRAWQVLVNHARPKLTDETEGNQSNGYC